MSQVLNTQTQSSSTSIKKQGSLPLNPLLNSQDETYDFTSQKVQEYSKIEKGGVDQNESIHPPKMPQYSQRVKEGFSNQMKPDGDPLGYSQYEHQSEIPSHQPNTPPQEPIKLEDIDIQAPSQLDMVKQQENQEEGEEQPMDTQAFWWKQWEQNNKQKIGENYSLYKIPKAGEKPEDSTIIGVIDQSGSMHDCFSFLAYEWNSQIRDKYDSTKCCIFHNLAYEADGLQSNPEMGTTDVEGGFNLLNNVLNQPQTQDHVTVIFISDGRDNEHDTIFARLDNLIGEIPRHKKINFLTIGVGEGFPTYLAMKLRQMYHTGELNIPPVFLVYNQTIAENWKITFQVVNKYLNHNQQVQTNKPVQIYPWIEPQNIVYENSYAYMCSQQVESLVLNGHIQVEPVDTLTPKEVLEVCSQMLSNIQIQSLKFNKQQITVSQAKVGVSIMENLKQKYWGKGRKKREQKEQIESLQQEFKDLIQNPDMKDFKNVPESEKDQHLALKLAFGAIGAGIGLYWMANNYGEFSQLMQGMGFNNTQCCGSCGMCDGAAKCLGCDSCGQCWGDIAGMGEDCCAQTCKILEYVGGFICGLLGE